MNDCTGVELRAGDAIAYVADSRIKFGRIFEIKSTRTGGDQGGWWVNEACMVSGVKEPYRLIDGIRLGSIRVSEACTAQLDARGPTRTAAAKAVLEEWRGGSREDRSGERKGS